MPMKKPKSSFTLCVNGSYHAFHNYQHIGGAPTPEEADNLFKQHLNGEKEKINNRRKNGKK